MPTYEYMCKNCGERFEVQQKMSDEPLTRCAKCNANSLQKIISSTLLINFKGGGFYANDSKASLPKKKNDAMSSPCSSCSSSTCSSCHK